MVRGPYSLIGWLRRAFRRLRYGAGISKAHVAVYRASRGWVGSRLLGWSFLLLTTTGRRSGRPRTVALGYLRDGPRYVVVASNAGAQRHPAWYHNLTAHPVAEAQVGRRHLLVRAHDATEGEATQLWPRLDNLYCGYRAYRRRARRTLPVVVLEPLPHGGG